MTLSMIWFEIAEAVDISTERVLNILREKSGMRNNFDLDLFNNIWICLKRANDDIRARKINVKNLTGNFSIPPLLPMVRSVSKTRLRLTSTMPKLKELVQYSP